MPHCDESLITKNTEKTARLLREEARMLHKGLFNPGEKESISERLKITLH